MNVEVSESVPGGSPLADRAGEHLVFQIDGELLNGHRLRGPISVVVACEQGGYVAHEPLTDLTGFGSTSTAALDGLAKELVDTLSRLEGLGDRLAPRLVHQRTVLRRIVALRDAYRQHA